MYKLITYTLICLIFISSSGDILTAQNTTADDGSLVLSLQKDSLALISTGLNDSSLVEEVVYGTKAIHDFNSQLLDKGEYQELQIKALNEQSGKDETINGWYYFTFKDGEKDSLKFSNGLAVKKISDEDGNLPKALYVKYQKDAITGTGHLYRFYEANGSTKSLEIPLWFSIIPPIIAILLALIFREVLVPLFLGIWSGAFILNGFSFKGLWSGLLQSIDKYLMGALMDEGHLSVIVFSLLIGGMVAIISRNGGMAGVVNSLGILAKSSKSSQFVTWLLGIGIFFDDYANTLIVGNTARSLTDRYRVSREKLAYIVDSTAAPVAAIALITTWIGAELGYIDDARKVIGMEEGSYSIFLKSLFYSFYPILTLLFILFLIITGRDFGPMLKAERRARQTGRVFKTQKEEYTEEGELDDFAPVKGKTYYAFNALVPILTLIIATLLALVYTGMSSFDNFYTDVWYNNQLSFTEKLSDLIGEADSYKALLWSSILGLVVSVILTLGTGMMNLRETMDSMTLGIKTMMGAMIILVLAWSLAKVTQDLHTGDYLSTLLQGNIQPTLLPVFTFILAGVIAFSTGSSWSTMAILYPIILPTAWAVSQGADLPQETVLAIFYNVTASVLAGSVFGDHCSPISDTTILSSLASNCNHIDHIYTQLPYAITVGIISIGLGWFSIVYNLPWFLNFLIGATILFLIVLILGRKTDNIILAPQNNNLSPTPSGQDIEDPYRTIPMNTSNTNDDRNKDDWIAKEVERDLKSKKRE